MNKKSSAGIHPWVTTPPNLIVNPPRKFRFRDMIGWGKTAWKYGRWLLAVAAALALAYGFTIWFLA